MRRDEGRSWAVYSGLALVLLAGCQSLAPPLSGTGVVRASAAQPEVTPMPQPAAQLQPPVAAAAPHLVPISLDTVFNLAQDRNGQIQIARTRVAEAEVGVDLARKAWLPRIDAGVSYFRHEGGIQDFYGNLIKSSYGALFSGMTLRGQLNPRDVAYQRVDAERRVWQQKGELSKLTNEKLLDAANTYLDLLAVRASEALAAEMDQQLTEVHKQAETLARVDSGLRVEVERVEAEVRSHQLTLRRLRENGDAAAAKLNYLLGIDPKCVLVPLEQHLVPLDLIDARQPMQTLVDRAVTNGPGVRELEGLLRLIDESRAAAQGPGKYMPALELNMNEGAFGAGPGSSMSFANQLNLALSLRWNLTEALTAKERLKQADLQAAQVHLSYHDLRARLTLGVTEARTAILSGQDQLPLAEAQVKHAAKSYELSANRLRERIKGQSPSEVLLAIRALGGARLQAIQTLRDLDKAEVRLLLLVGGSCAQEK